MRARVKSPGDVIFNAAVVVRTSWPLVPVIVIVNRPVLAAVVVLMVNVALPPGVTVVDERLAVTLLSAGETATFRLTV